MKNGLCTTICKNVRSARVSGNAHFGLVQLPTTTFAAKWAEFRIRCGNGARWDLKRNLGRRLLPVPPSLETRTKRGFPHFHSDDDGGLLTATTPNPTKIGGSYRFLHRTVKSSSLKKLNLLTKCRSQHGLHICYTFSGFRATSNKE